MLRHHRASMFALNSRPQSRTSMFSLVGATACVAFWSNPLSAAQASAQSGSFDIWNTLMLAIVLLTTASSAALSVAAWRQWQAGWRLVAALPIAALLVWVAWVSVSRYLDPNAHSLWSFELFGWALLNLLYMATVLTAKRTFEKSESNE